MQVSFLVGTIVGLVVLLGVLFLALFMGMKKKSKKESLPNKKVPQNDLRTLLEKVKNKNTSTDELQIVVDTILENFGLIDDNNFNVYGQILLKIARHPNTSTKVILTLDRGLYKKNPSYKQEINRFTSQGLNSREV